MEGKNVLIVSNYDAAYRLFLNKRLNKALEVSGIDFTTKYNYDSLTLITDLPMTSVICEDFENDNGTTIVRWPLLMLPVRSPIEGKYNQVFFNNCGLFDAASEEKVIEQCNAWKL